MRHEGPWSLGLALSMFLGGCTSMGKPPEPKPPVEVPDRPDPDLSAVTATLTMMEMLPEGDPARQAELFESAKNAASLTPTTSNKLQYALALATPGHAGSDAVAAQRQLSELLATPETLLPVERLLACVQLKDVDQRLILQAENKQLRDEAPRETRDKVQVINRRLAAESDENVRLRKALEEAQAKLEAVTHIERSINDRGDERIASLKQGEYELNAFSLAVTTPLAFGFQTAARESTPQRRKARILVVDDDPGLLRLLTIRLRAENYEVEAVESAATALAACTRFRPDLVITDLRMDQMDGIGLLKELQSRWPGLRVIILTAHGTIPDAVHATQSGAFGFLTKPVDKQDLLDHVQKALKVSGFAHVDEDWRANIVTRNQLMEDKLAQANMVAGTDARVLLTGESGTGKELLAHAIHAASPRRNKPFLVINCSAMAENLLESELFGHEKGAFSGATRAQKGAFENAEGGTLLLDEVGNMPMRLQVKLLRVLQENQIRPLGGGEYAVPINVRVISATHRDLHQLMLGGQFREDLYYRLNVVHIEMPSLGRRREDIPLLVAHFLEQIAKENGQRKIYAPEAVELLATAEWPGNIRQLYNVVRQNVALSHGAIITAELVQQSLGGSPVRLPSFDEARDEFTRIYLSQILQITGGNVSQAARLAKRNRTDFYKLLSRHQLLPEDFKKA